MIAIIDIGSNTIRLCVYDIDALGGIRQVYKTKRCVGLAGYIDAFNVLSADGIIEACDALKSFRAELLGMGATVSETRAFAAASLRGVANAVEVVDIIKKECGFDVTVISGEEEALCGFAGVANRMRIDDGLIIDIGGGSTEFVFCSNGKVQCAESLPVGSLLMYSKYVSKVIPTEAQCEKMRVETRKQLEKLENGAMDSIFGVGGAMRTLRKLNNAVFRAPLDNCAVCADNAQAILNMIVNDTRKIIGEILRLTPERVHTIAPGLVILDTIIKKYGCKSITISDSGVRDGYLIRNILRRNL